MNPSVWQISINAIKGQLNLQAKYWILFSTG